MSRPSDKRKSARTIRRFRALPEAVAPRTVDVDPDPARMIVPALFGDRERGTDQLRVLARTAWDRPCVYVAMVPPEADAPEATPPTVLYVGSTTRDLSDRWTEHLRRADGGISSQSPVPSGAQVLHRAVWLAVPVEAAFRRTLEDALTVLLAPVLQPAARAHGVRLSHLHALALASAGWTQEAAEAWIGAALGAAGAVGHHDAS